MSALKELLIVEDDPGLQKQLKWSFDDYKVIIAENRQSALDAVKKFHPIVITLDLGLPPDPSNASEGLATLSEILNIAPTSKIIVVTGNDDRQNALLAIDQGAYDFYQKPVEVDELKLIINRAFKLAELEEENKKLQDRKKQPLAGIIAASPQMISLSRSIEKIAPTNSTALLLGESGTGKEVLARAIHDLSPRSDNPFIAVNCAAIPENLLESELFGYEKGAFTGAVKQTKGKIEYADNGTLLLDEIGDLPYPLQAKLLRFMQERTIERIGGRKEIPIDVRIICATHQKLQDLIDQGNFRSDLYYRISEISINIPPLRDREGDSLAIAKQLLQEYSAQNQKKIKGFTHDAANAIANYTWPGNIRELQNVIKRAVILSDGQMINTQELEITIISQNPVIVPAKPTNLKKVRENAETDAIRRALSTSNNISEAARILGITRPTFYALLNKYGIKH